MKKDDRTACYTINVNGLNIITLGQKAEFDSYMQKDRLRTKLLNGI